jgi:hypothetical protein
MQTSRVTGTKKLPLLTLVLPSHEAAGFVFYAGCPVCWASKLQSQVALSTTEAKYIAMPLSLRDVIPGMNLIVEMKEQDFQVICTQPYVYCKVFEDNSGALELA